MTQEHELEQHEEEQEQECGIEQHEEEASVDSGGSASETTTASKK
jgi:hypothetical protein